MLQLTQMTRHVTTWMGLTSDPSECLSVDEDAVQESAGLTTVILLYISMAGLFLVLNFCTGQGSDRTYPKREEDVLQRRRTEQPRQDNPVAPKTALAWLGQLQELVCVVAAPRKPSSMYQQRLKMRLRRERELCREQAVLQHQLFLEQKRQRDLEHLQDWRDLADFGEEICCSSSLSPRDPLPSLVPLHKDSIYFDLPSEAE